MNFALDPGRIPRTYGQVFLLQLPAEPALDAARAQEQVELVPKEWKQEGLPGGAGDGNGAWPDNGRPEFVVDAWPAPRLPAAVIACGGAPGHDCCALIQSSISGAGAEANSQSLRRRQDSQISSDGNTADLRTISMTSSRRWCASKP